MPPVERARPPMLDAIIAAPKIEVSHVCNDASPLPPMPLSSTYAHCIP